MSRSSPSGGSSIKHETTTDTSPAETFAYTYGKGGRLLNGSGTDKVLYYVTDHLGSVRTIKDGAGTVRQRYDYYPFGTVSRVYTSSSTTDYSLKRYRFGGKEIAGSALTELGGTGAAPAAPYLDLGARLYSPRTATWLSVDPMAEKYYGIGPHVYCAANPLNLVDPEGMIWYSVNSNGYITIIDDEQDGPDRLYSNYPAGGIGPQMNTNFIEISDPIILSSLMLNRVDSFGEAIHYAITSSKEIGNVFLYLADNTTVEWSLEKYTTGEYALATSNNGSSSSTGRNLVSDEGVPLFNENSLLMSLHSHPRPDGTKGASLNEGYGNSDMLNITLFANRWYDAHNQSLSGFPRHYVYHKHSQTLYNYTPYNNSIFIKRILSGNDLKFLL